MVRAHSTSRLIEHRHDPHVLDAVAQAPVFRGIPMARVAALLDEFAEERFPAGQRIVIEGLRGHEFFLIVEGLARIEHRGWPPIGLRAGDGFGEIGVLGEGDRLATVEAITDLRCLVLPNRRLLHLMEAEPRLAINLAGQMVARFRQLSGSRTEAV